MIIDLTPKSTKVLQGVEAGLQGALQNWGTIEHIKQLHQQGKLTTAQLAHMGLLDQVTAAAEARTAQDFADTHGLDVQRQQLGLELGRQGLQTGAAEEARRAAAFPLQQEGLTLGNEAQAQQNKAERIAAPEKQQALVLSNEEQKLQLQQAHAQLEQGRSLPTQAQTFAANFLLGKEDPAYASVKTEMQGLLGQIDEANKITDPVQRDMALAAMLPIARAEMNRYISEAAEVGTRITLSEQADTEIKKALDEGKLSGAGLGRLRHQQQYLRLGAIDPKKFAEDLPHLLNNEVELNAPGFPPWVDESVAPGIVNAFQDNFRLRGQLANAQAQFQLSRGSGVVTPQQFAKLVADEKSNLLKSDAGIDLTPEQLQSQAEANVKSSLQQAGGAAHAAPSKPGLPESFWSEFENVKTNPSAVESLLGQYLPAGEDPTPQDMARLMGGPAAAPVAQPEPAAQPAAPQPQAQPVAAQPAAPARSTPPGTRPVPFEKWNAPGPARSEESLRADYARIRPLEILPFEQWRDEVFPDWKNYRDSYLESEYARAKKAIGAR